MNLVEPDAWKLARPVLRRERFSDKSNLADKFQLLRFQLSLLGNYLKIKWHQKTGNFLNRPTHGGNLNWAAAIAGCPTSVILDFSASINPQGPPQSALRAIETGLKALNAYPDPDYFELKKALAEWHNLTPEWILPGNGSAELLTWASWELSRLDFVKLVTPAFSDYWRGLKTFGAKVQPCSLVKKSDCWAINLENSKKNVGILLNNPHNPTGLILGREYLLPYLEKFALVVIDEAFMDFLPPSQQQSMIDLIADYPNLVILRSLTKFYSLPGLRLGYAIANPERLKRWQAWRDPWPVNILADLAARAVIVDQAFQQKTWEWLASARWELWQHINQIPGLSCFEGAANFLLVETSKPSSLVQEFLLKNHQIFIRDCLSFPELGEKYFRIAVKMPEDNQKLILGLRRFFEQK